MNSPDENMEWNQAINRCRGYLKANGLDLKGRKLLLAVSGGLDSICMLHLLSDMEYELHVAHVNYGLRGASSDADADLVRATCERLGVEYFERSVDLKDSLGEMGSGLQVAARNERYAWFEEIRNRNHFDFICTAHHQDDAVETFFINLIRGTGIKGLTGIPFRRDQIIRPMLCFSREKLSALALVKELRFREDATNAGDAYLRNRIRHHLVPLFRSERSDFITLMRNNQDRWIGEHALMQAYLEEVRSRLSVSDQGIIQIDRTGVMATPAPDLVLLFMLREFGFNLNQCRHIVTDESWSGSKYFSETHGLVLHRDQIQVSLKGHFDQQRFTFQPGQSIVLPDGILKSSLTVCPEFTSDRNREYLDASKLGASLEIRHWEPGDYFYPFGGAGRQKLQDFFTNEKLSPAAKARTWVLLTDGNVVWVGGLRIDDRFKVNKSTTEFIELKWSPFH
jgi:tRNA(Ile)-lysidine synthase